MPHLSKQKLDPNIEKQLKESLTDIISHLDTMPDSEKFLESVLSETERLMISKRIAVAFLLRHNIEPKIIGDTLKLTPETILRHRLWFELHKDGFDVIFDRMEKIREKKAIKDILYQILDYAIKTGGGRIPNPFQPPKITKKSPSLY